MMLVTSSSPRNNIYECYVESSVWQVEIIIISAVTARTGVHSQINLSDSQSEACDRPGVHHTVISVKWIWGH